MSGPNPADTSPVPLRAHLRDRLPDIFIEVCSIVIAVLLAQAAGTWHERQEQDQMASQARAAVVSEMRANQAELKGTRASISTNIAYLTQQAQDTQATDVNLSVGMNVALLSESAWHAALDTGAVQHLDFAWTMKVAKVYDLQELVLHAQSGVVDQMADMFDETRESPHVTAARLLSRERALAGLADGLDAEYREVLGDKQEGAGVK
ncbi:MAG TPA: hypothetical protein VGH80_07750 [Xanthomonadaceae bacterium]|jgi:hypothetical protein